MLFQSQFPARAGYFTVSDIKDLEKALGFPANCLVRNIPASSYVDGFISLSCFCQLVEDRRFSRDLDYKFDFHSSLANNAALVKAIAALNYHQMTFEDIHLARTAFHSYEHSDMKGIPTNVDYLLQALRLCGWVIARLKLKRVLHHSKKLLFIEDRLQFSEFIQLVTRCRRHNEVLAEYQKASSAVAIEQKKFAAVRGKPVRSYLTDQLTIVGVTPQVVRTMPRSQLHVATSDAEALCQSVDEQLLDYLDRLYAQDEYAFRHVQTVVLGSRIPPGEPLIDTEFRKRLSRSGRQQNQAVARAIREAQQTSRSCSKLHQVDSRMRQQSRATHSAVAYLSSKTFCSSFKAHDADQVSVPRSKSELLLSRSALHASAKPSGRYSSEILVTDSQRCVAKQTLQAVMIDTLLLPGHYKERVLDDMEELRPGYKQKLLAKREAQSEQERVEMIKSLLATETQATEAPVHLDLDRLAKPLTRSNTGLHCFTCSAAKGVINANENLRRVSSAN